MKAVSVNCYYVNGKAHYRATLYHVVVDDIGVAWWCIQQSGKQARRSFSTAFNDACAWSKQLGCAVETGLIHGSTEGLIQYPKVQVQ